MIQSSGGDERAGVTQEKRGCVAVGRDPVDHGERGHDEGDEQHPPQHLGEDRAHRPERQHVEHDRDDGDEREGQQQEHDRAEGESSAMPRTLRNPRVSSSS